MFDAFRDGRRVRCALLLVLALVLASCGDGSQRGASGVVNRQGFHVSAGTVTVDGGPGVAPQGARVLVDVAHRDLPTTDIATLLEPIW